jgi:hypothetical protein
MKLLYLLPILAFGWIPAGSGKGVPVPDYSEYVYLHVTRADGPARAQSCRGRVKAIRS